MPGTPRSGKNVESQALKAEQAINTKSGTNASLKATIEAAELYMQALRLAESPLDRKRIDAKCKELIKRAEDLKLEQDVAPNGKSEVPLLKPPTSSRKLTTRENIILLEGSKLNGFVFKPWDKEPTDEEFALRDGEEPFVDTPELPLSEVQLESFDGWKRPAEALSPLSYPGSAESNRITMTVKDIDKVDLVQDLTSDCSVVASLCAGTSRAGRGFQKVRSYGSELAMPD